MEHIIEQIKHERIVAILRRVDPAKVEAVVQALYDGGIRLVEYTFDQSSASALEDTTAVIGRLCDRFADRMAIGAGTVMTAEQTEAAISMGACFIVSPNTDRAVIERTKELGAVSLPGALTPSEIAAAYSLGADFVKLFPAGELGVGYIKAITAPLSHIPMLAVGGVDEHNMVDFLQAGVMGFGIGSNIAKAGLIAAGDYDGLTQLAYTYTNTLRKAGY